MITPHTPLRSIFTLILLTLTLPLSAKINIHTFGDSLTDEYFPYPIRNTSVNWVAYLAEARSEEVSLGEFTNNDDRGETRNLGYSHNWARSGARAQGVDVDGANTRLIHQFKGFENGKPGFLSAPQVVADADVATIFIGSNDYGSAVYAFSKQEYPFDQLNLMDMLDETNEGIIAALVDFVATIREHSKSIKIILITPPDLSVTPRFAGMVEKAKRAIQHAELPIQKKVALELKVSQAIRTLRLMSSDLTVTLEDLFEDIPGLVVVRTNDVLRKLVNDQEYGSMPLNVGHGGDAFDDAFTADDFHPGSLAQRIIAKKVVSAINGLHPEHVISPISKNEILTYNEG